VVTLRWTDWYWDPTIAGTLALTAMLYLWLLRQFPPRGRQTRYFWLGFLTLVIALLSPLHTGAAYLFWLHMTQHMLLTIVAPPLLVLGMPPGLLGWVYKRRVPRSIHRVVWSPVVATVLYNGVFVAWHLPAWYDATLRSVWIHAVEHASFVIVGLIFWGVVAFPGSRRPSLASRMVMLVVANIISFLVGLTLTFAGHPFYTPYTQTPRLWGFTPLEDQQIGGLIMWVGGQLAYLVPILALLYWFLWRDRVRDSAPSEAAV